MEKQFELPTVKSGRIAVNEAGKRHAIINMDNERRFYADKEPKDFDKKLKGYSWELNSKGTGFVTRYFLDSDLKVEIPQKFVKVHDGIRYVIEDMEDRGEVLENDEVEALMEARGKSAGSNNSALLETAYNRYLSMLKDSTRPISKKDREVLKQHAELWHSKFLNAIDNVTPEKKKRTVGVAL